MLSVTRIEGGLLGPDVLDQLLTGDLAGQRPADFGLPAKRNLTDEIAATFQDARALWGVFQHRLSRLPEGDLATSVTRDGWMIPLLGLLGYELHFNQRAIDLDGQPFAISHRAGQLESAPPVHIVGVRQELGRVPESGRPRLAPHSLVQEFLNRSEHVWGIVTNGLTLRLLRDTTFVRRQAYVEFDLESIFEEQRFDDFSVLFRLIHRTRLPRGIDDVGQCFLEQYYDHAREQGGRVREHLREGVEECLKTLANGFLRHTANTELQRRVRAAAASSERVSGDDLYRELLRIVYRFLFLLVSEERGLISRDAAYRDHYGVSRLRLLVDARAAYTHDDDLWQSLRVLWRVLADDGLAAFLGVAPLNGELFEAVTLDHCTIANQDLLTAIWRLSWYQEAHQPPRRVNYAALDVEELGSVYESLLEFHPVVDPATLTFELLSGSERKTTGSYYTPPELVNELIQSALDPVIAARLEAAPDKREAALLSIRVCDPACGSGHFLLAAARRIGRALARTRTGEEEPAPERVREATRDVIAHSIYGVDRNPLAVDLCRVALWLESHTGGKPLTFLDHRICCGDSLVGVFDLGTLAGGIPDKAFEPLEGDDKATARIAARQNRSEREDGTRSLFASEEAEPTLLASLGRAGRLLDALADDSPAAVRRKRQEYERAHAAREWTRQKQACDLWTAAFFQHLRPSRLLITTGQLKEHLAGRGIDTRLLAEAEVLSLRERFFHWPLEFPEVMADGGFDVVLSNPPWEHVELKEQEFFAARDVIAATAATKALRTKRIRELESEKPQLHAEYALALRAIDGARGFLAHSGRYPLTGRGRINTYAVFAELCKVAIRADGRSGFIVPSGIATDDTTKFYFQEVAQTGPLVSLFDFENRKGIFPAVDSRVKFCLVTLATRSTAVPADFVFFALEVGDLRRPEKRFTLTADEIALINPNTGNCPIFRSRADAELTKAIYRRVPVLWKEAREGRDEENPWRLRFSQGLFNMSSDSHHFKTAADLTADGYRLDGNIFVSAYDRYLPLYEAKMVHQFDHRWATYDGPDDARDVTPDEKRDPNFVVQPRYWVREEVVESAIPKCPDPLAEALQSGDTNAVKVVLRSWVDGFYGRGDGDIQRDFPLTAENAARLESVLAGQQDPTTIATELIEGFSPKWLLGWRDICRATDERTTISTASPKAAVGDTFLLMFPIVEAWRKLCLVACLNSFVQDYCARQKVGGTHMKYNVFRQLAVPFPTWFDAERQEHERGGQWLSSRAATLSYTAEDLAPMATELGLQGPSWREEDRFELRCEIDAAMFRLYLPTTPTGKWRQSTVGGGGVVDETAEQLRALESHLPTPRDAVVHILDQFPIVKQKDEAAHGRFRTKERILEIYDQMQAARRDGTEYRSRFDVD